MTNSRHHREPTCAQKSAATLYLRHFKIHATHTFFLRRLASVLFACTYVLRALHIDCRFCITTFTRDTVASKMPLPPCLSRPSCSLPQRRIGQPARSPLGQQGRHTTWQFSRTRRQREQPTAMCPPKRCEAALITARPMTAGLELAHHATTAPHYWA